jgi:hypothetical protein
MFLTENLEWESKHDQAETKWVFLTDTLGWKEGLTYVSRPDSEYKDKSTNRNTVTAVPH